MKKESKNFGLTLSIQGNSKEEIIAGLNEAIQNVQNEYEGPLDLQSGEMSFTNLNELRTQFEDTAGYKLSDNQLQFCIDAEEQGHEIDFTYSGRGMFGKKCPSVDVEPSCDKVETAAKTNQDSMGTGIVIYAQY